MRNLKEKLSDAKKEPDPIKIGKSKKTHEGRLRRKISNNDLMDFTNGLCTLVEARVPLDRALRLLDGITDSTAMKNLVLNLLSDVKEGKSLASAMEAHPRFSQKCTSILSGLVKRADIT